MTINQNKELAEISAAFSKHREQTGKKSGYSLELKKRAVALYKTGMSSSIIASEIKVHFTTLLYWDRKMKKKLSSQKKKQISSFKQVRLVEPGDNNKIIIRLRGGHTIEGLDLVQISTILQQTG